MPSIHLVPLGDNQFETFTLNSHIKAVILVVSRGKNEDNKGQLPDKLQWKLPEL